MIMIRIETESWIPTMYVCVCQAVTDKQISATIAQGATTLQALRSELGVGTCCGKCTRDVRSQLREECRSPNGCACAGRA